MSEISLLPSAEESVIQALLAHESMLAVVGEDGVGPELPEGPDLPFISIDRVGGTRSRRGPYWIDRPRLDVHAWGETKSEAEIAARTAHAVLFAASGDTIPETGAVITDVQEVQGIFWLPDPDTEMPRYLFTVELAIHPTN